MKISGNLMFHESQVLRGPLSDQVFYHIAVVELFCTQSKTRTRSQAGKRSEEEVGTRTAAGAASTGTAGKRICAFL
jgi:hypothetical protein